VTKIRPQGVELSDQDQATRRRVGRWACDDMHTPQVHEQGPKAMRP